MGCTVKSENLNMQNLLFQYAHFLFQNEQSDFQYAQSFVQPTSRTLVENSKGDVFKRDRKGKLQQMHL